MTALPCVHGTWPLVEDARTPGGIRLATGLHEEAVPVRLAAQTPDAEATLRTFGSRAERDGWLAAAREFGGNAVHCDPLVLRREREGREADGGELACALVLRFDRPRREAAPGAPVEEAVALAGPLSGTEIAALRDRAAQAERRGRADDAWRARWGAPIADLESGGRVEPWRDDGHRMDDRVSLSWKGPPIRSLLLRREAGVVTVGFRYDGPDAVPEASGFADGGDGWWTTSWEPGADGVARLTTRIDAMAARDGEFRERRTRLGLLEAATREPRAMEVLVRAARGFPLACHARHWADWQVRPETGRATSIQKAWAETLWAAGLLTPLHWDPRLAGTRIDARRPWIAEGTVLLVATDLGRTVAAGAHDPETVSLAIAASIADASKAHDDGTGRFAGTPALASSRKPSPGSWRPPAGAEAPKLPGGGRPRLPKAPDHLAAAAAWILHGLIEAPIAGERP